MYSMSQKKLHHVANADSGLLTIREGTQYAQAARATASVGANMLLYHYLMQKKQKIRVLGFAHLKLWDTHCWIRKRMQAGQGILGALVISPMELS